MSHQRASFGMLTLAMLAAAVQASPAPPLPPESRLVAAPGAPAATQQTFSISTAQDLQVTLTDLQIPAALASAYVVVTQGDGVVGSATLMPPATSASFVMSKAVGTFTLSVFGTPGASTDVGAFTACVAPKATPSACIQSASVAGLITASSSAQNPTVSTLSQSLNVVSGGAYTFSFADLSFPAALATAPSLSLFQGSTIVQLNIASGTQITLNPGTYTLLAIAQADPTTQEGLYGISITGSATLLQTVVPVGTARSPAPFDNPTAQSLTLKVSDFKFPGALASAGALITAQGAALGAVSTLGAPSTFSAPAGALQLWTYATAGGTPGTYEVDLTGASSTVLTTALAVNPTSSSNQAFAFVTPTAQPAGNYQASATDLQFPSQLTSLSFAVAQQDSILKQSASAGTLQVTTGASAPVIFLVAAAAPASGAISGNGLFDVALTSTAASPEILYDKTQSVSSTPALFDSQTLNLGLSAGFTVTLKDLQFPAAFDNLALVISKGPTILGKIYGGGPFSFPGTPGSYQLTFVASPASAQQFGLYGVSVLFEAPAITSFTSSVSSASASSPITLTWASTNAASCTGSGGSWSGTGTSGSQSIVLAATTTYTLTCTGDGGSVSKSVTVTATAASGGGGGGVFDLRLLLALALLWMMTPVRRVLHERYSASL
jgi:hypothetical protein